MRYFLTGGTGFVGGHLAEQLVEGGHEVVALARTPAAADHLHRLDGVSVVEGDVTDPETMRDPMTGVDGVFHVAGWYRVGVDDPTPGERVNVDGTRNVLELVAELDVPKAVYTSTLAVNSDTEGQVVDESYRYRGPHLSAYDRTKWEAHYDVVEPMVEDGVPVVTVMPGLVYGPGDTSDMRRLWEQYLAGDLPVIPRETAYTWGHVDDIAQGHVLAMESGNPGESYIVGGQPATLVEAFEIAERVTGIPSPRAVSPAWFALASRVTGLLGQVLDLPPDYHPEALRVLAGATYLGDNSKARRELGLEHRPLADGLTETLEAMRSERDDGR